jgi:hypothetical protein
VTIKHHGGGWSGEVTWHNSLLVLMISSENLAKFYGNFSEGTFQLDTCSETMYAAVGRGFSQIFSGVSSAQQHAVGRSKSGIKG